MSECQKLVPELDARVGKTIRDIITTEGSGYVYYPEDENAMHLSNLHQIDVEVKIEDFWLMWGPYRHEKSKDTYVTGSYKGFADINGIPSGYGWMYLD